MVLYFSELFQPILDNIMNGVYSDWVFNVLFTKVAIALRNNLDLLLLLALTWQKLAKYTEAKWDDKLTTKIVNFLTRKKKEDVPIANTVEPKK